MRALVSGQAGLAMVFDRDGVWSTTVESPAEHATCAPSDAHYLFAHADDVTELIDVTPSQVTAQLEEAWRLDRALQLMLILLDHEDDEETRVMAAECVEEHFVHQGVQDFVANRLHSAPLPTAADMLGAKLYADKAGATRVVKLLQSVDRAQLSIGQLRKSWDELSDDLFGDSENRRIAEGTVVAAGWFRRFAVAALAENVEVELMQCLLDERIHAVPQYRRVISQWVSPIKRKATRDDIEISVDESEEEYAEDESDKSIQKSPRRRRPRKVRSEPSIHERWTRVEGELEAIVSLVDQDRVEQSYRYTEELIERQVQEGHSDLAAKSLCNLAQQMKVRHRFDLQLQWSERAVEVLPTDPQTHNQLADAHFQSGKLEEALRLYEETMQQFPRNEVARNGRAEVLRELGRLEEALRLYEETMQQLPRDEVARCGRAEVLRELGRLEEALRLYEETMQQFPRNEVARCGRAEVLRELGRLEEALRLYEETMQQFPRDEVARNGRAEVLRELGRLEEALRLYEETMQQFPRDEVARCGRAEVLRELGRLEEALRLYEETMQQFPRDEVARCGRAEVLRELGRLEEALRLYEETMQQFPRNEVARCGRAEVLRELGRLEEALRLYEETMQQFPRNEVARCGRAEVLRELGRLEEALRLYEETMQQFPRDEVARNGLACTLMDLNRFDEALALLPQVAPVTRNNWITFHVFGMIHFRRGELEKAAEVFERGTRECPIASCRSYFQTALGLVQLRQGDFDEVQSTLEGMVGDTADVIRFHAFGELNDPENARAAYERLLDTQWHSIKEIRDELAPVYISGQQLQLRESPAWQDKIYRKECQLVLPTAA